MRYSTLLSACSEARKSQPNSEVQGLWCSRPPALGRGKTSFFSQRFIIEYSNQLSACHIAKNPHRHVCQCLHYSTVIVVVILFEVALVPCSTLPLLSRAPGLQGHQWQLALLFGPSSMRERGLVPNVVIYGAAVGAARHPEKQRASARSHDVATKASDVAAIQRFPPFAELE